MKRKFSLINKFLLFKNFDITQELRMDLNRIVWGICFGQVYFVTLNGAPFAGFVKELGVGDFLYGVLTALPLIGGLFQVLAAFILESTRERKKLFLLSGIVQRVPIMIAILLPLIVPEEWKGPAIASIMFFLILASFGGAFNGVTFYSWMADLIPLKIRGRFFSQRQMVYTFTGLIGGLAMSYLLDKIGGLVGFAIVFVIAVIFGLLDILCFIWVKDPPMEEPVERISFRKVWKETLSHPNFRRYLIFWSVWSFGISVAGPFFNAYMLEYLQMNYSEITLLNQMITSVFTILFVRAWGGLIDQFGNKPVLFISGLAVAMLPAMWIFTTPDFYWIIALFNVISGIFFCGIELTSANLMMKLSPSKNRSFYIANFNMVTALVGSILAYFTGGFLMELTRGWVRSFHIMVLGYPLNNYHLLFLISTLVRLSAVLFFLPAFSEDESHSPWEVIRHSLRNIGKSVIVKKEKAL